MRVLFLPLLLIVGLFVPSNLLLAQDNTGKVCVTIKTNTSDKQLVRFQKKFRQKNIQFDIVQKERDDKGKLKGIKLYLNSHDGFEAEFSYHNFDRATRIKVERDFDDPKNPIFIGIDER